MSKRFSHGLRLVVPNDAISLPPPCKNIPSKGTGRYSKMERPTRLVTSTVASQTKAVKITQDDCLQCSGCVPSVEASMVQMKSLEDFLYHLESNNKYIIVSLSPQSRASLANYFQLSLLQVARKLTGFFKRLGVKAVFDTSCSRDLSLIEMCHEFIARYKQHNAIDSGECVGKLPMFSSACPGFISSAEMVECHLLPYISTVKSPQQVMGTIVKRHLCEKLRLRPDEVYHVTVMPCYPKKMEAARDDFTFSLEETNLEGDACWIAEVDLVLTSKEVLELIQRKVSDFKSLEDAPLDRILTSIDDEGRFYGVDGGSGGYAESIFRHAAKTLFGKTIEGSIDFKRTRNSGIEETTLEVEGAAVLKFARCYGPKKLKIIASKIKMRKCDYHFVEIMECPSGCLHGDGQVEKNEQQLTSKTIELEGLYMQDVLVADPFENPRIKDIYDEWLEGGGSVKAQQLMHTGYHVVKKSVASQLND